MNGPEGKYAWTATVGEKGQIVIPKQAREIFGIHPGDTLLLLGDEDRGSQSLQREHSRNCSASHFRIGTGSGNEERLLLYSRARPYQSDTSRRFGTRTAREHGNTEYMHLLRCGLSVKSLFF